MAGSNDFTGQNIQDTYQRVLQISSSGDIADGTGSALPIKIEGDNVRVAGNIIANQYVVSSSVTNITTQTLSGSTSFGDSSDDIHRITGSMSYLGDMIVHGRIKSKGSDVELFKGDITASGNISASGIITAEGLVISDDATITDNLTVNGNILLSNDGSTISVGDASHPSITFGDDELSLTSATPNDRVVINNPLTVNGNIITTGNSTFGNASTDTHTFTGHITASGEISSSEGVVAPRLDFTSFGDTGAHLKLSSGTLILKNPNIRLNGAITASGNISSSGTGDNSFGGRINQDNNKFLAGTETGGTTRNILGINSSNVTQVANANIATNIKGTNITLDGPVTASNISASNIQIAEGSINLGPIDSNGILIKNDTQQQLTIAQGNDINTPYLIVSANGVEIPTIIGGTSFNDQNITNVGIIDVDKIRADNDSDVTITLDASGYQFNLGENDKNFIYYDVDEDALIHGDAGLSRVGISDTSPSSKLDVGGDLNVQSHITASGNISASGDTILNNLTVHGTQFTNRIDRIDNAKIGVQFGDGINVSGGHITASGTISSSFVGAHYLGPVKIQNGVVNLDADGTSYPLSSTAGILKIGHPSATFGTKFQNSVTASIISASGQLIANDALFGSNGIQITSGKRIEYIAPNIKVRDTGLHVAGGHITASGDISASGDIIGNNISASGDIVINEGQKLILDGNDALGLTPAGNTYIHNAGTSDEIEMYVGGTQKLEIKQETVHFNNGRFKITGNITASGTGNISASGDIIASNFEVPSGGKIIIDGDSTGAYIDSPGANQIDFSIANVQKMLVANNLIRTNVNTELGDALTDYVHVKGQLTASGNISASGTVIASSFVMDTNTNGIEFRASNGTLFNNISTNSADDFIVQNLKNGENLRLRAGQSGNKGKVLIQQGGTSTGIASFGPTSQIEFNGDITASGNISSSGYFSGSGLHITDDATIKDDLRVDGDIDLNGSLVGTYGRLNFAGAGATSYITNGKFAVNDSSTTGGATFQVDGHSNLKGNVTASNNISASGFVYGDRGIFATRIQSPSWRSDDISITANNGPINFDGVSGTEVTINCNTGEITASGNISASGNLIGDDLQLGGEVGLLSGTNILTISNALGGELNTVYFKTTGVGIGTSNPTSTLTVGGTINATSNITASNNISASGDLIANALRADLQHYKYDTTTDVAIGDVITVGSGPGGDNDSIVAGELYCLDSDQHWEKVDANASATSIGMLGIAIADDEPTFLLKGMYSSAAYTFSNTGVPLYVSETAGDITDTAPTTAGAYVRVVGYCLNRTTRTVFFDPDKTWVELS